MGFSNAPRALLTPVALALVASQQRTADLIAETEAALATDMGATPDRIAAALLVQSAAATKLVSLYALGSVLSRMASNLGAAGVSGSPTTQVGGDLAFLAAKAYGDAVAWTTIARANHMTDPVLTGVNELIIPPTSDGADGVLIP